MPAPIILPFLVTLPKKETNPVNGRIIKVSTYCQFASDMGQTFTEPTVYNHCKAQKIWNKVIDGAIFVVLDKAAFYDHFINWANSQPK